MRNAPVIKEVIKPIKQVVSERPPVQQTATVRKQAQTAAKAVAGERREKVAAAAERSAAARARRGRGGYRSLLARSRGGRAGGELARTLGGLD